jgi:hypothetical protein
MSKEGAWRNIREVQEKMLRSKDQRGCLIEEHGGKVDLLSTLEEEDLVHTILFIATSFIAASI